MAKITDINGDFVKIETESGKIFSANIVNLNFQPQIGDAVDAFRKDGKVVIRKKEITLTESHVGTNGRSEQRHVKKNQKVKKSNAKLIISCLLIGSFIGFASAKQDEKNENDNTEITNDKYNEMDGEVLRSETVSEESTYVESTVKEENPEQETSGVTGATVKGENGAIDDFRYHIEGNIIFLSEYIGEEDCVELETSYTVDGIQYLTDISDFNSRGSYDKLIIGEGFKEVSTGIFNGSYVKEVYFPISMTNVYDYTLAYMQTGNEISKIYYAGTQEEWSKIFTRYKRMKVSDAEFGEEWGQAVADKVNEMIGVVYDSSYFEYFFSSTPDDLR